MALWEWLRSILCSITRRRTTLPSTSSSATAEASVAICLENLQREVNCAGDYDLHDILSQGNRVVWPEWHLNIDEKNKAIQISEHLQQNFKKLKLSSSIVDQIRTIEETFLEFMPDDNEWNKIRKYFKKAREEDDPLVIIKIYTRSMQFSSCLNKHLAANTYHLLKLYCTILNCPILAQTQEYTEAVTSILFHPKLDAFLIRNKTVYRSIALKDCKTVADYKEGATIITTTFLSTSIDRHITDYFTADPSQDMISILCTYNINNTCRHTALDLGKISDCEYEGEILILRYVPFIITSLELKEDGRKMEICFDECLEQ